VPPKRAAASRSDETSGWRPLRRRIREALVEPRVDGSRALFQAVNFSPDGGATIARATDRLAPCRPDPR
jgi:hypothetical protein